VSVEYSARIGALTAPPAVFEALLGGDGAPPDELRESGAVRDGRLDARLERALRPVAAPRCELRLERGRRVGHGWVDAERATFLTPLPDGRLRLRSVAPEFVPEALARLNELGPRPRPEPAAPLVLSPAELGRRIAAWPGLREHWRVLARWAPDGGRAVEVVDTEAGLWLVVPGVQDVELFPTTPSGVFLLLAGVMPEDGEIGYTAGS
jgi:hypothetical protein